MAVSFNTENFRRSLIDRSSAIILLSGQSGTIQFASSSVNLWLGISSADLVGRSLYEIVHPQDAPAFQQEMQAAELDNLPGFALVCRLQHGDGTWHTFDVFARNLLGDPYVQGFILYLHDITERQRAEETLQRSIAELARSNAFIAALSQVTERIATTINPDQVLETLGRELEGIRLTCAVTLLDADGYTLSLHYLSIKPAILDLIERQTGLTVRKYRIAFKDLIHDDSWTQARFHHDLIPFLASNMPHVPQSAIVRAVRLAGVIPFTPVICLPLTVRDRMLGYMAIWGHDLREGDIKALSIFANQVAGTFDKALLLETIQRRVQETETLRKAAAVVTSALDLDQVLDRILTELAHVIPYDSAAIFLLDGNQFTVTACQGVKFSEAIIGQSFPAGEIPGLENLRSGQPFILADVQAAPPLQGLCMPYSTRCWMGIPLIVRGALIGLLTLESHQVAAYGPENEAVSKTFANQAAIAIDNARLFKQVQQLAITDSLTGLFNRRHFFESANHEFERTRRYGRPLSLLMWDIDHFKRVNDQFGHLIGDQVLQAITQRCQAQLREVDILGRYGGEEFVALLPETDLERARQAAERLCQAISRKPIVVGDKSVSLSISIGVAELDDTCLTFETLLDRVDQALYLAKQSGRNQVMVWKTA